MKDNLTDEEKTEIQQLFSEEIVPKLKKLDARLGTISCEFAGPQYANWMIQFKSRGEDFDIVDFGVMENGYEHLKFCQAFVWVRLACVKDYRSALE